MKIQVNILSRKEKGTMHALQHTTYNEPTGEGDLDDLSIGTETILLVDDEEPVQYVVREILERRGYRVLAACDGPAALTLSSDFQGPIHLLLTDIVMPRMSGLEVAKYLAADRPSIKILYMSGYPETVVFEQERLSPGRYFLRKPFLAPTLARKVRQVLNDPSMNGSVSH
jgi:two-component system cell cycle sensor histidine kinase/response regulator CckA